VCLYGFMAVYSCNASSEMRNEVYCRKARYRLRKLKHVGEQYYIIKRILSVGILSALRKCSYSLVHVYGTYKSVSSFFLHFSGNWNIHTYKHTHIYIHTYTHISYIHTYIHTNTHTHTYIHTYIHTYTHTHRPHVYVNVFKVKLRRDHIKEKHVAAQFKTFYLAIFCLIT
jgi:hypothetical protein